MSTTAQIDYDALARQHGGSSSNEGQVNSSSQVDYDSLAAQHGGKAMPEEEYASKLLSNASISAPESGIGPAIDRLKNKVITAFGGNTGGPKDAQVGFVGGPVLGPLSIAHGQAITPQHPIRGTAEQLRGLGQTLSLPMAVAAPEATAMSLPRAALGIGVSTAAQKIGINPDVADIMGTAASIGGPEIVKGAFNSPNIAAKAAAIGKVAGRTITGQVPLLGNVEALRTPTFGEYWNAINAKADPQLALFNKTPKLANTPLSTTPVEDALLRPDNLAAGRTMNTPAATANNLMAPGSEGSRNLGTPVSLNTWESLALKGDPTAKAILENRATAAARATMPTSGQTGIVINDPSQYYGSTPTRSNLLKNQRQLQTFGQASNSQQPQVVTNDTSMEDLLKLLQDSIDISKKRGK